MRLAQEMVLGIGGVRALRALGIEPAVFHMNEGHSAFLVLERGRELVESGLKFAEAKEANDILDKDFRQSVNLERQKSQLEARIKEAGQSLNTEHTIVRKEINTLEVRINQLPELKKQLGQAQSQVRQMSEPETALRDPWSRGIIPPSGNTL